MPNILIYLTDDTYIKWVKLSKGKKKEMRDKFKDLLTKEG